MHVESLEELQLAFAKWRKTKKHIREGIPRALLGRAQRCVNAYGVTPVVRVTGVDRRRFLRGKATGTRAVGVSKVGADNGLEAVPQFSRLDLGAPTLVAHPVVELESGTGMKVRFFAQTPEMMALVATVCGIGGAP